MATAMQRRIEQDERELEELMKGQSGEQKKPELVEEDEEDSQNNAKVVKEETKEETDESLTPEEKTYKKRYGDLRRHSNKQIKDLQDQIDALKSGSVKSLTSREDVQTFIKENKAVAGIIERMASDIAEEKLKEANEKLERLQSRVDEEDTSKAEETIRSAHPDFDELKESNEFHDWVDDQPKWVQDALYVNEDDPRAVIRVLDLYKVDQGNTPSAKAEKEYNNKREAASAVSTKSTTKPVTSTGKKILESQVQKMTQDEYEEKEAVIMAAMREGNFVYDISGGTR